MTWLLLFFPTRASQRDAAAMRSEAPGKAPHASVSELNRIGTLQYQPTVVKPALMTLQPKPKRMKMKAKHRTKRRK